MRIAIALFSVTLIMGCSGKRVADEDSAFITQVGVIIDKEAVDLEHVERETKVDTRVFASVSTGGRISIGLGFLLSPFFSDDEADPVRYQVKINDGSEMTIYHPSHDFEIDDCVEIKIYPDEEKNPPRMRRDNQAC